MNGGFLDFLKDPRFLNNFATGMQAFGQFSTGRETEAHGEALRIAAQFQADQLREQAGDAIASAQRAAFNEDRRARYVASDILAKAAASGGGASDPTIVNLIAQTAAEGAYRQQVALYEGDARARQLRLQATAKEFEGASEEASAKRTGRGQMFGAATTLLKGYARDSMLARYGGDGPRIAQAIGGWSDF